MLNPDLSSNSSNNSSDMVRPDSSQDCHHSMHQTKEDEEEGSTTITNRDHRTINEHHRPVNPFTQSHQKTPFAIQELLGLSSNDANDRDSGGGGGGGVRGAEQDADHHQGIKGFGSHPGACFSAAAISAAATSSHYSEAAARSFISAASSFASDNYGAGRLPSYFNSAAAGLFSNLQNHAAAAAASSGAFPSSISPDGAGNMSHLLQVESPLRGDHPMHGKPSLNRMIFFHLLITQFIYHSLPTTSFFERLCMESRFTCLDKVLGGPALSIFLFITSYKVNLQPCN